LFGATTELLPAAAIATFLTHFLRTNGPASLENAMSRNKPLMDCTGHWKSIPVLPMF
jgi:hypothetical protein